MNAGGGLMVLDAISSLNVFSMTAEASSLALSSGQNVNMLAPFTEINFINGLVTGNLIAGIWQVSDK